MPSLALAPCSHSPSNLFDLLQAQILESLRICGHARHLPLQLVLLRLRLLGPGAFIHEGVSGGLLASAHRFELALPVSSLAFPLLLLFAAAAGIGELLLKRCNALLMV